MPYIFALDQGTTNTRCIAFDQNMKIQAISFIPLTQIYTAEGYIEHDPMEILDAQIQVMKDCMQKLNITAKAIAGIGIANQRETTILWDKRTGKPIYNAIVWQCRRTTGICKALKAKGLDDMIKERTGLIINSYFSGTKIKWILDNVPNAREEAKKGNILFGTVETWLIYNLSKDNAFVTDYTNASRTMLFNIHTLQWDEEILKILDIPKEILPEVKPSASFFGETADGIKIAGAAGDQQAASFGQFCLKPGNAKNTYGTGCFALMNIGEKPVIAKSALLTTIAIGSNCKMNYALEGSVFIAGAAIKWLKEELGIISTYEQTYEYATQVEDTNDVYFVPAFTGLGAPHWDQYARGLLIGIERNTNKYHIVRAVLESLAYQSYDVIKAIEHETNIKLNALKVDGGVSINNFVMQFQSDILDIPVIRPNCTETTALGAGFLAAIQTGFYDMNSYADEETIFYPSLDASKIDMHVNGWHKAVSRSRSWID